MSMGFEGSIFGGGCAKVRAAVAAEAIDGPFRSTWRIAFCADRINTAVARSTCALVASRQRARQQCLQFERRLPGAIRPVYAALSAQFARPASSDASSQDLRRRGAGATHPDVHGRGARRG